MRVQQQAFRPPKDLLLCPICQQVYYRPITLSCGHTFCRDCLWEQKRSSRAIPSASLQQEQAPETAKRAKLSVCLTCESIIWKGIPEMKENLAIQNLVTKLYPQDLTQRINSSRINEYEELPLNQNAGGQYFNKIIIKIECPAITPMPCCYSDIQFQTSFIDDIVAQSQSVVVTWKEIEQLGMGLLCKLKKVEPLHPHSALNRVIFNVKQSKDVLQLKYKGSIEGICYVDLHDRELIGVNLRHKLIILGEGVDKVIKYLQICNCSQHQSGNEGSVSPQHFNLFFGLYDNMNNPHYLKQIRSLINDEPFQSRSNPQLMLYCVLRLLKIPNQQRTQLVMSFDEGTKMQEVNSWLLANSNKMIDEVIHVRVPGKYNTGLVFFIIFILLAFNLFQDYGNKIM